MRITILLLALLLPLRSHAATYFLLSQTNTFAAGITNKAKAYTDAQIALINQGSTNITDSNYVAVARNLTVSTNLLVGPTNVVGELAGKIGGAVGTAGTYGNASYFPVVTTDANGRVSVVTTNLVSAGQTNATLASLGGAPLVSPALTGTPTINGQSVETQLTNKVAKAGDTLSGALAGPMFYTTPTTLTQSSTNVVVDFSLEALRLLTATNDLYFTTSTLTAGKSVLVDVTAGTTNRNLAFDSNFIWMCTAPTTLASNHVAWVVLTATTGAASGVRASYTVSQP